MFRLPEPNDHICDRDIQAFHSYAPLNTASDVSEQRELKLKHLSTEVPERIAEIYNYTIVIWSCVACTAGERVIETEVNNHPEHQRAHLNQRAWEVLQADEHRSEHYVFRSLQTGAQPPPSSAPPPYLQPLSCWRGFPVRWTSRRNWHPSRLSHTFWSSGGKVGKTTLPCQCLFFSESKALTFTRVLSRYAELCQLHEINTE